ncbi:MAG TPA: DUF2891 domain-containing protein [Bacteroidales bacterium]|nr:DUF2891 domain-containing protein [Bacteroidales bacterium]
MKKFLLLILLSSIRISAIPQQLTMEQAVKLARLPLNCINTEYPNKTSHLINDAADAVMTPAQLHPAFYGCLDWHSSVHGHWMLVRILKQFPGIPIRDSILSVLHNSFNEGKIRAEADYYVKFKNSNTYERTYGWAWLLKLDQELIDFDDPAGIEWHKTLQPLTNKIVELWKDYITKQTYPNRTGVHPNTAFGLVFALDWARAVHDTAFEAAIVRKANEFYLNNIETPAYLEPDGTDFLSPSLEIADLMSRILQPKDFEKWFKEFYKPESIANLVKLPVVSDRSDYLIVHLDGLTLSRAWCMKGLARALPEKNSTGRLFTRTSEIFLEQALPNVLSGNYGGEHWLASFAVYALSL